MGIPHAFYWSVTLGNHHVFLLSLYHYHNELERRLSSGSFENSLTELGCPSWTCRSSTDHMVLVSCAVKLDATVLYANAAKCSLKMY